LQVLPGGVVGSTGGTVTAANGNVSLLLPSGAVSRATPISVTAKPDTVRTEHTVGSAYLFVPSGTTFAQPVTIALRYDAAALPPFTDLAALRVARLVDGKWVPLSESVAVDSATATVRAVTRSFSAYVVGRDPCLPFKGGTSSAITGVISAEDCLFSVAGRRSDYYNLHSTAGELITLRGSGNFDGLFGLKERTLDPTTGVVWTSQSAIARELRLVSNGEPLQLFISGRDSTKFGSYMFQRLASAGNLHECVTLTNEKTYIGLMPGTSIGGTMLPTNICEVLVASAPPNARLVHRYPVRLLAGRQYTITGSGFHAASSLAVVLDGQVVGEDLDPTNARSVTVTPTATVYYFIEVRSGGFDGPNNTGNWIRPEFIYTVAVSPGAT
jgi:hypothetical protein